MKKVIKTCSVNPGLVSIGFMHTAKLSDLILTVKGSNRGLVLLRLAVLMTGYHTGGGRKRISLSGVLVKCSY